jgi:hypothetical protein
LEKGPTVGKTKPTVREKRHELGIYETKRSVLYKIQHINNSQISFFEKIQGNYDALYKRETRAKQDLLYICKLVKLMSNKTRGE